MNSIADSARLPLENGSASIRRFLFPGFLIFSVCFYSYRFLFGLGSPLTTYYDSDAPNWVRVTKDVIWLAVLLIALASSKAESWEFASRNWQEHPRFFRALSMFVFLFVLMGVIHLFYYQSATDTFLYWIRYPLEYVPIAFLTPLFVVRWRPLVPMLLGLGWVSVCVSFFRDALRQANGFLQSVRIDLWQPERLRHVLHALYHRSARMCSKVVSLVPVDVHALRAGLDSFSQRVRGTARRHL